MYFARWSSQETLSKDSLIESDVVLDVGKLVDRMAFSREIAGPGFNHGWKTVDILYLQSFDSSVGISFFVEIFGFHWNIGFLVDLDSVFGEFDISRFFRDALYDISVFCFLNKLVLVLIG